ncbi:MAG TPA: cobalamin B12-binding domain-containing protein [Rhizobiaceae bacterium]|nr:cobalamin B12-binding domain-containing protein [Rhizobiaceae bacterium]
MQTALKPSRPLRVVMTKVGLDGHDRGVKVIAQALRDAGMEVIYTGLRRTPDEIADIVLQEDADVLGLSILSGAVVPLTRRVSEALKAREIDDVLMVVGGIVTDEARGELAGMGIEGVFGPGSSLAEIIGFIQANVLETRVL